MTSFRRVVTGHDAAGLSRVASDETVSDFDIPGMPGTRICHLWGADETLRFPDDGARPACREFFPPVGGFRMLEFTVPPGDDDAATGEPDAATEAAAPGLLATMDPSVPGMHRSATVDLLYVVEGRCVLELDDGSRTTLAAGDTAVQSGTMHAWRNPFDAPCRILAVTVGARLDPGLGAPRAQSAR